MKPPSVHAIDRRITTPLPLRRSKTGRSRHETSAAKMPSARASSRSPSKSVSWARRLKSPTTTVIITRAAKSASSSPTASPLPFAASTSPVSPACTFASIAPQSAAIAGLRPASAQISRIICIFSRGFSRRFLAQALGHRRDDAVGLSKGREGSGALRLLTRAKLLDDRFLRGEIAVEIARAHRRFGGDMLHSRRVKAMPHESTLGGLDDAHAPIRVGPSLHMSRFGKTMAPPENERSFSVKADYGTGKADRAVSRAQATPFRSFPRMREPSSSRASIIILNSRFRANKRKCNVRGDDAELAGRHRHRFPRAIAGDLTALDRLGRRERLLATLDHERAARVEGAARRRREGRRATRL